MNEENSPPTCVICMFLENFRGLLIDDIGVVTIYAAGLLSAAPAPAQPRLCVKHGKDVIAQIGRARAAALMTTPSSGAGKS